jgi:hypothetical protein
MLEFFGNFLRFRITFETMETLEFDDATSEYATYYNGES